MPDISIIVPFYNVERYVRPCVDSMMDQTIPAAELVLVDDGSTDDTGAILDGYADGKRIRVFHKENGGISDARNFGVARCRYDFISFVDGDDIISPRYVESLSIALDAALSSGSHRPLVFSEASVVKERRASALAFPTNVEAHELKVFSCEEAARALYRDRLKVTAWGKAAPKALYEQIPFPVGRVYEDWHVTGKCVCASDCIVHVPEILYGHVMHGGSITNRHGMLRDAADYLEAIEVFEQSTASLELDDAGAHPFFRCLQLARVFACLEGAHLGSPDPEALEHIRTFYPGVSSAAECRDAIRAEIAGLLPGVLADPEVPRAFKMRFRLLVSSARLYEAAFRGYGVLVKGVRR